MVHLNPLVSHHFPNEIELWGCTIPRIEPMVACQKNENSTAMQGELCVHMLLVSTVGQAGTRVPPIPEGAAVRAARGRTQPDLLWSVGTGNYMDMVQFWHVSKAFELEI